MKKLIFMICGKTCSGKTTLVNTLNHECTEELNSLGLRYMVPVTTRPKRPGEIANEDYIFVNESAELVPQKHATTIKDWLDSMHKIGHLMNTELLESRSYKVIGEDGNEDTWEYGFFTPESNINFMIGTLEVWEKLSKMDDDYDIVPIFIDADKGSREYRYSQRNEITKYDPKSDFILTPAYREMQRRLEADDVDFPVEKIRAFCGGDPNAYFVNENANDFKGLIKEVLQYMHVQIERWRDRSFGFMIEEGAIPKMKMYMCKNCKTASYHSEDIFCPICTKPYTEMVDASMREFITSISDALHNSHMVLPSNLITTKEDQEKAFYITDVSYGGYVKVDEIVPVFGDKFFDVNEFHFAKIPEEGMEMQMELPSIEIKVPFIINNKGITIKNMFYDAMEVIIHTDMATKTYVIHLVMRFEEELKESPYVHHTDDFIFDARRIDFLRTAYCFILENFSITSQRLNSSQILDALEKRMDEISSNKE